MPAQSTMPPASHTEDAKKQALERLKALFAAYSVKSYAELKQTKEFKDALVAAKDNEREALARLWRKPETVSLPGWFVSNEILTKYEPPTKGTQGKFVEKARGPKVLLDDGSFIILWGNPHSDMSPLTPVLVQGARRVFNIETGKTSPAKAVETTKMKKEVHGRTIPALKLGPFIDDCFKPDTTNKKKSRGVIRGETYDGTHALTTVSIEEGDEGVRFFQGGGEFKSEPALTLTGKTPDGLRVQIKPDVEHACRVYGLTPNDRADDFRAAICGKTVLAHGKLKVLAWTNLDMLKKAGLEEEAMGYLKLIEPHLKTYSKVKGSNVDLRGLDMNSLQRTMAEKAEAEGKTVPNVTEGLDLGHLRILDIREEQDPGNFVFYAKCRTTETAEDIAKHPDIAKWPLPKLEVVEKHSAKNAEWVGNRGAFLRFIEDEGEAKPRTAKDDAMDLLFQQSGGDIRF